MYFELFYEFFLSNMTLYVLVKWLNISSKKNSAWGRYSFKYSDWKLCFPTLWRTTFSDYSVNYTKNIMSFTLMIKYVFLNAINLYKATTINVAISFLKFSTFSFVFLYHNYRFFKLFILYLWSRYFTLFYFSVTDVHFRLKAYIKEKIILQAF